MRRPDWFPRLRRELHAARPFAYGESDCCLFAARCVEAIRGAETLEVYRGKREAIAYLRREGGLEAAVTRRLGTPIKPEAARLGDVVLAKNLGRRLLGIHVGTAIAAQGKSGVVHLPLDVAILAWRVD